MRKKSHYDQLELLIENPTKKHHFQIQNSESKHGKSSTNRIKQKLNLENIKNGNIFRKDSILSTTRTNKENETADFYRAASQGGPSPRAQNNNFYPNEDYQSREGSKSPPPPVSQIPSPDLYQEPINPEDLVSSASSDSLSNHQDSQGERTPTASETKLFEDEVIDLAIRKIENVFNPLKRGVLGIEKLQLEAKELLLKGELLTTDHSIFLLQKQFIEKCNKLALKLLIKKKYEKAVKLFNLTISTCKNQNFLKSANQTKTQLCATTYNNLGIYFKSRKNYHESKRMFESALLLEESLYKNHINICQTKLNLAAVLSKQARHNQALDMLKAIKQNVKSIGKKKKNKKDKVMQREIERLNYYVAFNMACELEHIGNINLAISTYARVFKGKKKYGFYQDLVNDAFKAYHHLKTKLKFIKKSKLFEKAQ